MNVDAVVLDIDNVLVDTSASYERAIIETLQATFGRTIDREAIQWFKDAGGFNNDWRVTDAAALYLAASERGYAPDLRSYTDALARRGGGLAAAQEELTEALDPATMAAVEEEWDQESLRRIFQWAYLGPDRYRNLERTDPPIERPAVTDLIDEETILLDDATRRSLSGTFDLGILTGRPRGEAEIALERIGLDIGPDMLMTMDDWAGGKPDPEGLVTLGERLDATAIAYAGDELDDVRTAVNADRVDEERTYYGIGVQSGGVVGVDGRNRFRAVGAAAVIEAVSALPELVEKRNR